MIWIDFKTNIIIVVWYKSLAIILCSPDSAGWLYESTHFWLKILMGTWMSLHHSLVDLKAHKETLSSSFSFKGLDLHCLGFFAAMRGSLVHVWQLHLGCSVVRRNTSLELVNFVAITGNPWFVVASPCLQRLMERSYSLNGSMASFPPMFRCLVYVIT